MKLIFVILNVFFFISVFAESPSLFDEFPCSKKDSFGCNYSLKEEKDLKVKCDTGNVKACYVVGFNYLNNGAVGKNKKKNLENAKLFLQKACDAKIYLGCTNIGNILETGFGVLKKDTDKAISLYKLACENGDALGCFSLGTLYYEGSDIEKNTKMAINLFERACSNNSFGAGGINQGCTQLAFMY